MARAQDMSNVFLANESLYRYSSKYYHTCTLTSPPIKCENFDCRSCMVPVVMKSVARRELWEDMYD